MPSSGSSPSIDAFMDIIDGFMAHLELERAVSKHTSSAYENDLKQFSAFLVAEGVSKWESVTPVHASGWAQRLSEDDFMPTSLARKLSTLRMFSRYLIAENCRKDDFCEFIQGPKLPRDLPHTLTPGEIEKLVNAPSGETVLGLRDRAILEMLYSSGLRVSELCGLLIQSTRCSGSSSAQTIT